MLLVGCGGAGTEPKPTIAGTWTGNVITANSSSSVTLTLQQSGTSLTGNGAWIGTTGTAALTVSGTFTAPSMSLTIGSPVYDPINFPGTISGRMMTGTMNGSGFVNTSVTLTRQ
jgi:hypothetical protein